MGPEGEGIQPNAAGSFAVCEVCGLGVHAGSEHDLHTDARRLPHATSSVSSGSPSVV